MLAFGLDGRMLEIQPNRAYATLTAKKHKGTIWFDIELLGAV